MFEIKFKKIKYFVILLQFDVCGFSSEANIGFYQKKKT